MSTTAPLNAQNAWGTAQSALYFDALPFALYFFARYALCVLLHLALGQSFDKKLDQLVFLLGLYDFIAAGLGPGGEIG